MQTRQFLKEGPPHGKRSFLVNSGGSDWRPCFVSKWVSHFVLAHVAIVLSAGPALEECIRMPWSLESESVCIDFLGAKLEVARQPRAVQPEVSQHSFAYGALVIVFARF